MSGILNIWSVEQDVKRGRKMERIKIGIRQTIEKELRRGTSKSRIAAILKVEFEEAQTLIEQVKLSLRPQIGDRIRFVFRDYYLTGAIIKLLNNSAVVLIDWDVSDQTMRTICNAKTVVNFKDIKEFV